MAKSQIVNTEDASPMISMTLDELRALLAGTGNAPKSQEDADAERERKIEDWKLEAKIKAEADRGARIPEVFGNGPQKSVFNPDGDVRDAHYPDGKPRAELMAPYPTYILGMKVTEHSTITVAEHRLLRQVQPGLYKTEKDDGTFHQWDVRADYDPDGKITKLMIDSKSSMKDYGKMGLGRFENILRSFNEQHAAKKGQLVLA